MLSCDICKKSNQGRYRGIEDNGKYITACYKCLGIAPASSRTDKETWEHISTPFWVHAGMKPTAENKATLNYMKAHNMSWGDLRKERDLKAQYKSALPEMEKWRGGKQDAPKYKKR